VPKGIIVEGEEDLGEQLACRGCEEYYPNDKEFYANKRKAICRACVADGVAPKSNRKQKRPRKPEPTTSTDEKVLASRQRHLKSYYLHQEERKARMRERARRNADVVNQRRRERDAKRKEASATIRDAADTSPQQGGGGSETAPAVSTSSE